MCVQPDALTCVVDVGLSSDELHPLLFLLSLCSVRYDQLSKVPFPVPTPCVSAARPELNSLHELETRKL